MRTATARVLAWLLCALLLLAFGTPLRALWAQAGAPWWSAYALWALAIAGLYVLERTGPREPSAAEGDDATVQGEPRSAEHEP